VNIHTPYSNPEDEGSMYLQNVYKTAHFYKCKYRRAALPSILLTLVQAEGKDETSTCDVIVQPWNVILW
jgi:hypothetical protein